MNAELIEAFRYLEREKEIPHETLLEALEVGMATAYKKSVGTESDVQMKLTARLKLRDFEEKRMPIREQMRARDFQRVVPRRARPARGKFR